MNRNTMLLYNLLLSALCLMSCDKGDNEVPVAEKGFYSSSIFATIDGIGSYNKHGAQGFAVYNNVGFIFYDSGYCQTIDLQKKCIVSSFSLPKGVANSQNHCGVACFSSDFMETGDKYPLLYLSSYKELKCYVLRMTETSAELIQVIQMKDEKGEIMPVYAFMPDDDYLLLKTNRPTKENNSYTYHWEVAKKPGITDNKDAYLTPLDILNSFSTESSDGYNAGFCRNGKIYQLAGYYGYGTKKLYIIDYTKGVVLKEIIWEEPFLYLEEHEQCSPYGEDGMLINYNGADYISYIKFTYWRY